MISILISSRRFCASSATSSTSHPSTLVRPVFALYGHCTGYRIPQVLSKFQLENNSSDNNKNASSSPSSALVIKNFIIDDQQLQQRTGEERMTLEVTDVFTPRSHHRLHKKNVSNDNNNDSKICDETKMKQQHLVINHNKMKLGDAANTADSSSSSISSKRFDKKQQSTKMFRGLELDFEEDFEDNHLQRDVEPHHQRRKRKITNNNTHQQQESSTTNNNNISSSLSTFTSSTGFAHVVFRLKHDKVHHATIGIFSNGSVVSFGCTEEKVRSVVKLFADCERQDPILFPPSSKENRFSLKNNNRIIDPQDCQVSQELSLTTIGDLPNLGYSTPSWLESAMKDVNNNNNNNNNSSTHQEENVGENNQEETSKEVDSEEVIIDEQISMNNNNNIPSYIGYFDAGELSSIVLPSTTSVEAELPFLHSLAESAEVEFLSIYLDQLASKTQSWRAQLEKAGGTGSKRPSSFSFYFIRSVCPLREVRVTYLQALRLSAKIARLKSRSGVFWTEKHAPQRVTYECAYDHLEIADRLGILESQVNTVTETVSYLGEELRFDTEFVLEIAIIGLIMMSLSMTCYLMLRSK